MMTQIVSLKFVDFQQSITTCYKDFRRDKEFSDVTLVCGENQPIEAHRLILTACSPFFRKLLKRNKHPNPIIYMRGLKTNILVAILDYIYHGEANICQEDLNEFFALAEELQLKGLVGCQKTTVKGTDSLKIKDSEYITGNVVKLEKDETVASECNKDSFEKHSSSNLVSLNENSGNILVSNQSDMDKLKTQIESMSERVDEGDFKWKCSVCGKKTKLRGDIKRHVEKHIKGMTYACSQCGKVSRSNHALYMHILSYHIK